jgi:hypothetical protein
MRRVALHYMVLLGLTQDFLLGLKPVIEVSAGLRSPMFEQLVGPLGNTEPQVIAGRNG